MGSVDLGDTTAVTRNLTLPAVPGVTWSTSDPSVVTAQGEIIRPAVGQGDATATLKATFTHRGLTDSRSFPITVKQRVAVPAEQLRAGLRHFFKLDETSRDQPGQLGNRRARPRRSSIPRKATLTRHRRQRSTPTPTPTRSRART